MHMTRICESASPTEFEVLQTLCENSGRFIRLRYVPLPECKAKKNPNCPSAKAAKADTLQVGDDPFLFAGYILTQRRGGALTLTKTGNLTLTLRTTTRQKKLATGTGYYADKSNKQEDGSHKTGFVKGEFQYRAFRLDRRPDCGLDLSTVEVSQCDRRNRGLVRLFPNVAPMLPVVPNAAPVLVPV